MDVHITCVSAGSGLGECDVRAWVVFVGFPCSFWYPAFWLNTCYKGIAGLIT